MLPLRVWFPAALSVLLAGAVGCKKRVPDADLDTGLAAGGASGEGSAGAAGTTAVTSLGVSSSGGSDLVASLGQAPERDAAMVGEPATGQGEPTPAASTFVPRALTPSVLPTELAVPYPGNIVDGRPPPASVAPSVTLQGCENIVRIAATRQRTTTGPGVQLDVALMGPDGRALSSVAYAECLVLEREPGDAYGVARSGGKASNALTMIVARPGASAEENAAIATAARQLFLSRPAGERVALYRWGETLQQVSDFTNFYDSFSDSLARGFPAGSETPLDALTAISTADRLIRGVVEDGGPWARNVVVIAPTMDATHIPQLSTPSNVMWLANGTLDGPMPSFDAAGGGLDAAVAWASAISDELRTEGFVSFGICTNGASTPVTLRVAANDLALRVLLKEAMPEQRAGLCDPVAVSRFDSHDSRLLEMQLDEEATALHSELVRPESRMGDNVETTKNTDFPVEFLLSPAHAPASGKAHLRGASSLTSCDSARLSYAINLDQSTPRFLVPEARGGVGSDKFSLISMCLDPMYLNQVTANSLMRELELFGSAFQLLELRVNGQTKGVYLLLENPTVSALRQYAGVSSVLRRDDPVEVKFPDPDDFPALEQPALDHFAALAQSWPALPGAARLEQASGQLDLRRFLYLIAFNSALWNADWNDEPYFIGLQSTGPADIWYRTYGRDADDLLKGACDHPRDVVSDPFGLLGCAEHRIEVGIFGTEPGGGAALDDEAYAFYVDVLEQMLAHLSEERVATAFQATGAQLKTFAADPAIVEVMPDWRGVADVPAAIDAAVAERVAAYRARRNDLVEKIQAYRSEHP